jgi:hypothetical protein
MKFVIQALRELQAELKALLVSEAEPAAHSSLAPAPSYDLSEVVSTLSLLIDKVIDLLSCTTSVTVGIYQAKLFSFLKSKPVLALKASIFEPEAEFVWAPTSPLTKLFKFSKPTYLLSPQGLYYVSPFNPANKPVSPENEVSTKAELINWLIAKTNPDRTSVATSQNLGKVTLEVQEVITHYTNHSPALPLVTTKKQIQVLEYLKGFIHKISANAPAVINEAEAFVSQFWLIANAMSLTVLKQAKAQGKSYIENVHQNEQNLNEVNEQLNVNEWLAKNKSLYPAWMLEIFDLFINAKVPLVEFLKPFKAFIESLLMRPNANALYIHRLPEPQLVGQFIENLMRLLLPTASADLSLATEQLVLTLKADTTDHSKVKRAAADFLRALFVKEESRSVRHLFQIILPLLIIPNEKNALGQILVPYLPKLLAKPEYQEIGKQLVTVLSAPKYSVSRQLELKRLRLILQRSSEYAAWVRSLQELVYVLIKNPDNKAIQSALQDFIQQNLMTFNEPASHKESEAQAPAQVYQKTSVTQKALLNLVGVFIIMYGKKSPVTQQIKEVFGHLFSQVLNFMGLTLEAEVKDHHLRWQEIELQKVDQLCRFDEEKVEEAVEPLRDLAALNKQLETLQVEVKKREQQLLRLSEFRKNAAKYAIERPHHALKAAVLLQYDQAAERLRIKKQQLEQTILAKKNELNNFFVGNLNLLEESLARLSQALTVNKDLTAKIVQENADLLERSADLSEKTLGLEVAKLNKRWQERVTLNQKTEDEYQICFQSLKTTLREKVTELDVLLKVREKELNELAALIDKVSADLMRGSESLDHVGNVVNVSKHVLFYSLKKIETIKLDILELEKEFQILEGKMGRFIDSMDLLSHEFKAVKQRIRVSKANLGFPQVEPLGALNQAATLQGLFFQKKETFENQIRVTERHNRARKVEMNLNAFIRNENEPKNTRFMAFLSNCFFGCGRSKAEKSLSTLYVDQELKPALRVFMQTGNSSALAFAIQNGLHQFRFNRANKALFTYLGELQNEFPLLPSANLIRVNG